MSRLLLALACTAVISSTAAAAPPGWTEHRVAGAIFAAPKAAEVTTRELPEQVVVIAVTHKHEVLLLTLYRGKSAPSAKRAIATHGEEFERRVSKLGAIRLGRDSVVMLGRKRSVRTIQHGGDDMRERTSLTAVRLTKTTVVAAWTAPADLRRTMSSTLLKGLKFE